MTTTDDRPATAETIVLDQRAAAYVLGVLQVCKDTALARYNEGREIGASQYFTPGDRFSILDPVTGAKVGSASMTDPDLKAEITDRELFTAFMAEEDPDSIAVTESIDRTRIDEVLDVLREHAPDLLTETTTVRPDHEERALNQAQITGDPVPGVEVHKPLGHVSVRLSAAGKELIRRQIADGDIDALRALPAKET
jgi:hypothetical protein